MSCSLVLKIGMNKSLMIGGFTYFLIIVTSTIPAWYMDHPVEDFSNPLVTIMYFLIALINGFWTALMIVAVFSYVDDCSIDINRGLNFGLIISSI